MGTDLRCSPLAAVVEVEAVVAAAVAAAVAAVQAVVRLLQAQTARASRSVAGPAVAGEAADVAGFAEQRMVVEVDSRAQKADLVAAVGILAVELAGRHIQVAVVDVAPAVRTFAVKTGEAGLGIVGTAVGTVVRSSMTQEALHSPGGL